MCNHCGSREYKLTEVQDKRGRVLASTTIHVPPSHVVTPEPYTVVVFEFQNGLRLMGRLDRWLDENLVGREAEIVIDQGRADYRLKLL